MIPEVVDNELLELKHADNMAAGQRLTVDTFAGHKLAPLDAGRTHMGDVSAELGAGIDQNHDSNLEVADVVETTELPL